MGEIIKSNKISLVAVILVSLTCVFFNFSNYPSNALSYDVFGYYLYLPQIFIYHDISVENYEQVQALIAEYKNTSSLYQLTMAPNGNWVMKYSMGMALLYLPFFLIGHVWALFSSYPADGFSFPYQASIVLAGMVYTILGFWFLRKLLLRYFSELVTTITLLVLFFGTNFFFHSSFHGQGTMTHNFLFAFYALILLESDNWYRKPELKYAIRLGFLCGLAILARPSEIICLLIPLFWGIHNLDSFKQKVNSLWDHKSHVVILGGILAFIGSFQVIYWLWVTGKPLYYSYGGNAGEGFEFFNPYTWEVLFSFRKGWLVYTPLMSLSIFGFCFLWQRQKQLFVPVLLFFLTNLYIVSSWSCWWYAESFSQRALIQSYAVLALPIGACMTYILSTKRFTQITTLILISGLIVLNLFQTWQMANSVLHPSRMTQKAYFAIFGQVDLPESYFDLLLVNRDFEGEEKMPEHIPFKSSIVYHNDFETSVDTFKYTANGFNGSQALLLQQPLERSPEFRKAYKELSENYFAWFRISVKVFPTISVGENPTQIVVCFEHNHYCYKYKAFDLYERHLELNNWNEVSFDYLSPEIRRGTDQLKVYVEHLGNQGVLLDDFKVEVFEEISPADLAD